MLCDFVLLANMFIKKESQYYIGLLFYKKKEYEG